MTRHYDTNLPPDLKSLKQEIEGYARDYGLDFYETIFEVIEGEDLNEIAAYGGFPTRYPHWSFGMSFEELKKSYDYGLSKIYEMVINNDPCYAYLMRCNHTVDQKLVMAHVYAHCDFFKNNAFFGHTSRKMMDEMANHGMRLRGYAEKHGEEEVETFVDRCMSIDDLIDVHSTAIRRRAEVSRYDFDAKEEEEDVKLTRFKSKGYMNEYINPPKALKAEEDERRKLKEQTSKNFPERPEKDVLLFLIEHAPLKGWQRDVLSIIRDEAYYFAPQGQTKIMNEGWACLRAGALVSTDQGLVKIEDIVENKLPVRVHDGQDFRRVYDWARFPDRATVRVRTRRGLEVEGSTTHRVLLAERSWRRLDEVRVGDRALIDGRHQWKTDNGTDEIVSIERGRADVFDISVEATHRYAAGGFINHNSYWHSTIMTQKALKPSELLDYADHHSGTMAMHGARINPYKLGIELFRNIEHRWNTGKFGKDYDDCDDLDKRRKWDKQLGLGRQKIFEVRRVHNDITFIDTFLTPEFCVEHKLFSYAFQEQGGQYVIESREFDKIKQRLLYSLTNFGRPWIYVVDGNYRNRGELLLKHEHNGVDLKLDHAAEVLANIQFIWSRPVHLQTVVDGKATLLSFDGSEHTTRNIGESDDGKRTGSGKTR